MADNEERIKKVSTDVSKEALDRGMWDTFMQGELARLRDLVRVQNPCVEFQWNKLEPIVADDWLNMLSDVATDVTSIAYGEIYYNGAGFNTVMALQDTWYQVLGFDTDGESYSTTPDHTTDDITILVTGKYLVTLHAATRSANINTIFILGVLINNGTVFYANSDQHRTIVAAGRVQHSCSTGICSFTIGDTVEAWVMRTTGLGVAKTITFEHITLNVTRIGD